MALNKQTGNMYPDITFTWNPLRGECPHKCKYCSTNKLRERYPAMKDIYSGELRLSDKHFADDLGSGKTIFVCAQNDLFARAVPEQFIYHVLRHCRKYPENTYYFQSKNPVRMIKQSTAFPDNSVFLTTIETNRESLISTYSGGLKAMNRAIAMSFMRNVIITIEPIMDFDMPEMIELIEISGAKKVYIGADSGNNSLPEPYKDQVGALVYILRAKGIEIIKKSNLERLI